MKQTDIVYLVATKTKKRGAIYDSFERTVLSPGEQENIDDISRWSEYIGNAIKYSSREAAELHINILTRSKIGEREDFYIIPLSITYEW